MNETGFSGIKLGDLQYDVLLPLDKPSSILRSVSTTGTEGDYTTTFNLELHPLDFIQLDIIVRQKISLKIGELICPECHQERDELDHNQCFYCMDPDNEFSIRLACLFQKNNSLLVDNDGCDVKAPHCESRTNSGYCHAPHILYIGRFGSLFKVGISRKSRKGGYLQRLIEQGFNEAYAIMLSLPLPDILKAENTIVNMGMRDRIYFEEKIAEFGNFEHPTLQEIFDLSLIEEMFPDADIIYHQLYEPFEQSVVLATSNDINGKIVHIQGSIIILENSEGLAAWNMKHWCNRRLISLSLNDKVIL